MPPPDRHDCAVVLSCDQAYLPWALCLIRQMDFFCPGRGFDFVIAAREALDLPGWAAGLGIRLHQSGDLPQSVHAALPPRQIFPMYRLMLARELADSYRRILYVDSDILMEGGDLDRLFGIDLGPHPLGAVLDAPAFSNPVFHAREFQTLNLPRRPYLNAGVLLIDTARYVSAEVEARSFEMCRRHPQALPHADQSVLNLALMGGFAQLAPCWNWMASRRLPFATFHYPVFLRHFAGPVKPDRYTGRLLSVGYNQTYRDFLARLMPEALPKLVPAPAPAPLTLGEIARFTLEHLHARPALAAAFARHADPYRALI
jgi:hypothetical protein